MRKGLLALLTSCMLGCATTPPMAEYQRGFPFLEAATRREFLALLPEIPPDEQPLALESIFEGSSVLKLARKYNATLKIYDEDDEPREDPAIFTPKQLEIFRDESNQSYRARLAFKDGRVADVTELVTWHVSPPEARLKDRKLETECLHGEAVLTTMLLNEMQSSLRVPVLKKVRELRITVAPSTEVRPLHRFIVFQADASCNDGTTADVSCAAEWQASSPLGGMDGCGRFALKTAPNGQKIEVKARWGGAETARVFTLPLQNSK